jgi:hypothetical protein
MDTTIKPDKGSHSKSTWKQHANGEGEDGSIHEEGSISVYTLLNVLYMYIKGSTVDVPFSESSSLIW